MEIDVREREKPGDCRERERAVRDKNHMREP